MLADYHLHSLCSDGVLPVPALVARVRAAGLAAFALTDHDTLAGLAQARAESRGGPAFVPGVELTCRQQALPGADRPTTLHLLGYGVDPADGPLVRALERRARAVRAEYEALCRALAGAGFPVRVEEVPISCGQVLQLGDVAAFVLARWPETGRQALPLIDRWVARLDGVNLPLEEGLALIRGAGGKPVWAHPFWVYQDFCKTAYARPQVEQTAAWLCRRGLAGLEADYRAFSPEDRQWLHDLAARLGLLTTGGSDFHGSPGRDGMGVELAALPPL